MKSPATKSKKNNAKKKEIIDATFKCIYEKGAEEISMRSIAREADINQSTLHYYFKNKENLLTEFIRALFDRFIYDIEKRYKDSDTPEKKLEAILEAGRTFGGRQREMFIVFIHCWALSIRNPSMQTVFSNLYQRISDVIDGILQEGYEQGVFNKVRKGVVSASIIAFVQGIGCQWLMTKKAFDLKEFFDIFADDLKKVILKKV